MTMEKQKENPKFSFLFGGDFYGYYKYKLALEQQQREWGSAPFPRGRCGLPRPPLPLVRRSAAPGRGQRVGGWWAVLVVSCSSAPAGRPGLASGSWRCPTCDQLRPPDLFHRGCSPVPWSCGHLVLNRCVKREGLFWNQSGFRIQIL